MKLKTFCVELKINERNVKKNIKELKNIGLIERTGSIRRGYWVVKNQKGHV
jgi:predicted HTH transcriptional regulator